MPETGGIGPLGRHGNRVWGDLRPGTRAYAMKMVGWAAFEMCPVCSAQQGKPCKKVQQLKYMVDTDEPHKQRKMISRQNIRRLIGRQKHG